MPRLSKIGAAAAAAFGITGNPSVPVNYLIVAGGGAGGGATNTAGNGGGGAGGLLTGTTSLTTTQSYTIVVGAGGASTSTSGSNGSNSSISVVSTIAIGGGGGGGQNQGNGAAGGSGGGGYYQGSGGSGTSGQGNAGGAGSYNGSPYAAGGGGGAGSAGSTASSASAAGNGGAGLTSSISGSSVYYAGGGGGGVRTGGTAGTGGAGGGGAGTNTSDTNGNPGTPNLGGGGGGSAQASSTAYGGAGGSGVVIISYTGAQQFGGGVVTSVGGNTIHTFNTSGTLVPLSSLTASYLIVAGGGGGGGAVANASGGGGAGGLISGSGTTIDTNSNYVVTVGSGGSSGAAGANGGTGGASSFSIISNIANGGGYGAGGGGGAGQSVTNASGGGGSAPNSGGGTGGTGTVYGNNGGAGSSGSGSSGAGGGGGGSGTAGSSASGGTAGSGGAGTSSTISGVSVTYAAGGAGAGGSSGAGASGASNTGNGGVGGAPSSNAGGAGGSGVVIISYPGSVQQMAGGTVTISGGNVIHTFTSSGYLAPLKFVGNSLRFRSSANGFLNRTPTTSGTSDQKMTLSVWVKRSIFGVSQTIIGSQNSSPGGNEAQLLFNTDNLRFYTNGGSTNPALITNATYRDPAAWYHIVFAADTTQATASNRFLMYVNGVQVTSFSTATYPSQNASIGWNVPYQFKIGQFSNTNEQFDGYMAEFNYIDGQALGPNAFGAVNQYGQWQPITYRGSYGINGFYLPFSNTTSTTTLGYDFSNNSNNWTTNNISLTAGSTYDAMTDVPTLTSATAANYCVLNPLSNTAVAPAALTNGNLTATSNSSSSYGASVLGTMAVSSGKWYWEYIVSSSIVAGNKVGIVGTQFNPNFQNDSYFTYFSYGYGYQSNGQKSNNNSSSSYGASYTNGDVIGVAFDADGGTLTFYKNGVSQGTAFTGISGTFTPAIYGYTSSVMNANFGQQPFSYTPPSGFVALNTYNL